MCWNAAKMEKEKSENLKISTTKRPTMLFQIMRRLAVG